MIRYCILYCISYPPVKPAEGPRILGLLPDYSSGDRLNVCVLFLPSSLSLLFLSLFMTTSASKVISKAVAWEVSLFPEPLEVLQSSGICKSGSRSLHPICRRPLRVGVLCKSKCRKESSSKEKKDKRKTYRKKVVKDLSRGSAYELGKNLSDISTTCVS